MIYDYAPIIITKIKTPKVQSAGETVPKVHFAGRVPRLAKRVWKFLIQLNIHLPIGPNNPTSRSSRKIDALCPHKNLQVNF